MSTEFTTHGFTIDLDAVYHAMWDHSDIEGDQRVFMAGRTVFLP